MLLSARLSAIVRLIPPGSVVVDVGTDHAQLPIYLLISGLCPRALATELNRQPYQRALAAVREAGLTGKIDVRLGDGLSPLLPGEADVAVLAGMGGATMSKIIQAASPAVLAGIKRLVLQPMADAGPLRLFLARSGFALVAEELVREGGQIYPVIAAEPGEELCSDQMILELGPRLYEQRHPLLAALLAQQITDLDRVLAGLQKARRQDPILQHKMALITKKKYRLIDILSSFHYY
ncbi:MAG: tRNA (adenine(22)-N(1))-methyltransferase [Bacillota bacterium]